MTLNAPESTFITKFETKSNRVKGLSFHPKRPWLLASLHIGTIQMWDYRMGVLLEKYEEHEGPVRGICFHSAQPLFVSGGDDFKVKVWNHKLRRCLFTLLGHLDYIRTTQFHQEYPWIISASDDQTARIWNWQSRTCIATLTGHNHYVMCAQFHNKQDLVVTASLDQTVRVWDVSALRQKSGAPGDRPAATGQSDLFSSTDATVKYVLEGHDRGVNWACFHPTLPLILSSADDRQIKLWRHNDTKAWEVDTFRGHFNNVSCVLFHPRQDLFLSNSEDKSIRVWDIQKRTCLHTFRRENDRFWILASHPTMNLFAAGHDNGLIVFKLERERPASTLYGNVLYYIKDRYIRTYEHSTARDLPVMPVRRNNSTAPPRSMSYNPAINAVLVNWDCEGGYYELYWLPKDGKTPSEEAKKGPGLGSVFVARNKFAVLDVSCSKLHIKSLKNETTKTLKLNGTVDGLFYAGTGQVLLRFEDKIALYDVQRGATVKEFTTPRVKYVVWSKDMTYIALVCKHAITICDRKLTQLGTVHETIRIKGGAWDENSTFIYATLNHIKYTLPNGDNGIIRTLEVPLYLTKIDGPTVYALDREVKIRVIAIDPMEYLFKHALIDKQYSEVLRMIKSAKLIGKSIVSYLQKKGFPEVALHFVKDPTTRFSLAIECGNVEVALESAKVLEKDEVWQRLAVEALRQGNHQVVEMAYQRTKNFAKLSFLYLITGNIVKLKKMLQIAQMRNDTMGQFHNALYLGAVEERVNLLKAAGQSELAFLTARTHGLDTEAQNILETLGREAPPQQEGSELLIPPTAILRLHDSNWPLLTRSKGYFEGQMEDRDAGSRIKSVSAPEQHDETGGGGGDWGGSEPGDEPGGVAEEPAPGDEEGDGWANNDDEDVYAGLEPVEAAPVAATSGAYVPPTAKDPSFAAWRSSSLASECAAAGAFETAMQLLNKQLGVVNFAPLKRYFLAVYQGSRVCLPGLGASSGLTLAIQRNGEPLGSRKSLPCLAVGLQPLIQTLQKGYQATTAGKFGAAVELFMQTLHAIPMLMVDNPSEVSEVKELVGICREYVTGLRVEAQRKDTKDPKRNVELAAYFTHSTLETTHMKLVIEMAMKTALKAKCNGLAGSLARRLLELAPAPTVATKARQVLQSCEKAPSNEFDINYDERNPFVLCCRTFTPIYQGSPSVKCPYCGASYKPEFKDNTVCTICQLARVGAEAAGLTILARARA